MLYQLPSGKVIYLSIEEYLSLSDYELHQLVHSGLGEEPPHPTKGHKYKQQKDSDNSIDMGTDGDDQQDKLGPIDWNSLSD